jgi:hypothetical protein
MPMPRTGECRPPLMQQPTFTPITLQRESLVDALKTLQPCVNMQAMTLDILKCYVFAPDHISTYNDSQATVVKYATGLECALPATILLELLNSLTTPGITVSQPLGRLLISADGTQLDLHTLPAEKAVFSRDQCDAMKTTATATLTLTDDIIEGMSKCMLSVDDDPASIKVRMAAQLGITCVLTPKQCALYATNNASISRAVVPITKEDCQLTGPSARVILPTLFCTQILRCYDLAKQHHVTCTLYRNDQGLVADLGTVTVYSKLLYDPAPVDMERVMRSHAIMDPKQVWHPIPAWFAPALERAHAATAGEVDRVCRLTVEGNGVTVEATSQHITLFSEYHTVKGIILPTQSFTVDAQVLRAGCDLRHITFFSDVVAFRDGDFMYIVSHLSKTESEQVYGTR